MSENLPDECSQLLQVCAWTDARDAAPGPSLGPRKSQPSWKDSAPKSRERREGSLPSVFPSSGKGRPTNDEFCPPIFAVCLLLESSMTSIGGNKETRRRCISSLAANIGQSKPSWKDTAKFHTKKCHTKKLSGQNPWGFPMKWGLSPLKNKKLAESNLL